MRVFALALLAASAIGAVSMGSATAMPFGNPASAQESLIQDVRVVCDRHGRCYNTRRNTARYYAPRGHRYGYRSGYRVNRAYGYNPGYGYSSGPSVGIGIGPVGIGVRTW